MAENNLSNIVAGMTEKEKQALHQNIHNRKKNMDIAVIGLGGRYPQSEGLSDFWRKILNGESFITEVPKERWNHEAFYDPHAKEHPDAGKTYCKYGSFLKEYNTFDADFFELSNEEMVHMDPQERLSMEAVWDCLENAGYRPESLGKKVGIFSGLTYSEYQKMVPFTSHLYMVNNRIAYFYDFKGPSVAVDAGCCSSLAAIHFACGSLEKQECSTAVVVGANVMQHPDHYISVSSMLSGTKEPCSRPFGTDDGWIPAEGVVSILLKPLQQAEKDRDHIYAVIKSTHISQEGRTAWFMAFNPKQQARLMEENFQKSGIHPQTISYVEAAANGSSLGDAIELEGLTDAFSRYPVKKGSCPIGTVKANVGHGEAVSTLLQLSKVILQFQTRKILPIPGLGELNSHINVIDSPFYLAGEEEEWKQPVFKVKGQIVRIPRRAALSSFASGGAIGHLILEEYEVRNENGWEQEKYWIPLSSKSEKQLKETIKKYLMFFQEYKKMDSDWERNYTMGNIMFTLCTGRKQFQEKVVFLVKDLKELIDKMKQYLNGRTDEAIIISKEKQNKKEKRAASQKISKEEIQEMAWDKLACSWLLGADIDWESYFEQKNVFRVSLPGYSFDKGKISEPKKKITVLTPKVSAEKTAEKINQKQLILELFAEAFQISEEELDLNASFDTYGLSSETVVSLGKKLERYFGPVPVTLFFECRTIQEVMDYLEKKYPDKMVFEWKVSEKKMKPDDLWIEELTREILSGTITKQALMEKLSE